MDEHFLTATLGLLFALSEFLSLNKSIASNGVFQLIVSVLNKAKTLKK